MSSDVPLYIEGAGIHQEGYESGYRGRAFSTNPYPESTWLNEVWLNGWSAGDLDLRALSEPLLAMPQ